MGKAFRVAHIVPVSHLMDTESNQYHMCLAHLVDNKEYRDFYAKMAGDEHKYVLMDNGAAEGSQLNFEKLVEMYGWINPDEIVLPDTLYEPGSTIQKSREFLQYMAQYNMKYKTMAVPQGKTLEEWEACARIFMKDTRINSIGVSKFLNIATGDRMVRYKAVAILDKLICEYGRHYMEVHLLGCDEGPLIVRMIQKDFPFVRGCDSAFAYLQAQANKLMTIEDDKRPEGTINFLNGEHIAGLNMFADNFNQFAGVSKNGYDATWLDDYTDDWDL